MKCQVLIDWLTFSVKTEKDPRKVIKYYLGLDPALFQDMGYGLLGYSRVLRFSDICVCYEPRENEWFTGMGVCVSMSGNGCRAFETMSKLTMDLEDTQGTASVAFPALFQLLASDVDANVSRLDIACDDRSGLLCMDDIIAKTQSNEINSRMTARSVVVSYNGTQRNGSTVYIGASSSDFRVRIYDKALEQGADGHWVRVEMVMRGKNSNAFVERMTEAESVGKLAAQVMNDKFSFIVRDDSNITRCTVCGWWQNFVDELEAVRLVARKVIQHSVEQIAGWVEAQVGPSLAILRRTLGLEFIARIARNADQRLCDKQRFLIADFNSLQLAGGIA